MSRSPEAQAAVSHLKSHIGFWMRFVSNHVSHAFARKLEQSGVTVAEWVVMREMFGESQTSPSVVAGHIGMTRGAITKIVDRLLPKASSRGARAAATAGIRRLRSPPPAGASFPRSRRLQTRMTRNFSTRSPAKSAKLILSILKKLVQAHGLEKLPTE